MIVDTHVHIMAPDQRRYPRALADQIDPQYGWARCDFSAESLLAAMDEAGIERALLVQAYNAYRADNRYVADVAQKYPERFRMVCIVDPREPDSSKKLDHWVRERGAAALRIMLQDRGFRLDDPRVAELAAGAARLGVPVCLFIWWDQIGRVAPILDRHPDLTLLLDHMGQPALEQGPPYRGLEPLLELARYPNLLLKFSSATVLESMRGASAPREWFARVIERFGPQRLLWGSNFPMNAERGIPGLLRLAQEALGFLSEAERAAVFGGNALRLWPFPQAGASRTAADPTAVRDARQESR